ncbi:MAG: rhomboid family intramembrane serine protease [Solirubrobacterales bacterium]|nr:rhomboid family intramembrane serine protease [Solirubrobacterales bacterium]
MATCYKHPDRETGVACSNCERPICTDCMTPTSVGMRCPDCANQKTRVQRGPQGGGGSGFPRRPGGGSRGGSGFGFGRRSGGGSPQRSGTGVNVGLGQWSATTALIALNVVVFFAEMATGVTPGGNDQGSVFIHGSLFGPAISGVNPYFQQIPGTHEVWRLLSAGFLHASLLHIVMNMWFLFFVGRMLEPGVGRGNFLAIYLASLLAGSFGALAFTPVQPTVGASTAIFGVFGALIVVAHDRGIPIWQSGLGPTLLINLVLTLTISNISIGGHLGGLLGGVVCGYGVVYLSEHRRQPALGYAVCAAVAVVSVIGALAVAGGQGLLPNGFHL